MAKTALVGEPWRRPSLTRQTIALRAAPSLSNPTALSALNHAYHLTGPIAWDDRQTHDVAIVHARLGSSSLVGTLRCSLQNPHTTADAPARGDGTIDQFGTLVNPSANSNQPFTLDVARTVAHLETVSIVFDVSAFTSGSVTVSGLAMAGSADYSGRPSFVHFDGTATWTPATVGIHLTVESNDGHFGVFLNAFPRVSAAINAHAFNTGTSPKQVALEFTVEAPVWCGGADVFVSAAAGADFDVVLMTAAGATLATSTVTTDSLQVLGSPRWVPAPFSDVALVPGTTYRLAIVPSTGTSVTAYSLDVSAAGHLAAFVGPFCYAQQSGADPWATTTTRFPFASLHLTAIESGGGDGGARSLFNAGIN